MNAWILAALLCAPASAAVVETVGAAAPAPAGSVSAAAAGAAGLSPIQSVPAASVLAPSLNAAAVIRAFPEQAAGTLPAGAVRLAPPAPAASPLAAPASADAPAAAAPSRRSLPPGVVSSGRAAPGVPPAGRRRDPALERAAGALAARLEASRPEAPPPAADVEAAGRLPAEGAADMGRRIFDRAAGGALLADGAFAPGAAAFAPGPANAVAAGKTAAGGLERGGAASAAPGDGEALRDAVAAPPSALAAAPAAFALRATPPSALGAFLRRLSGAAPASAGAPRGPASAPAFERLTLEFGAGLVVKVRSVLGLAPAVSPRPFSAGTRAPRPAAGSLAGAPLTSTEWLERRGLLESLSASEAAAGQAFAARGTAVPAAPVVSSPAPASAPSPARAPLRSDAAPSPALWLLAFLPAAVVLFKELR